MFDFDWSIIEQSLPLLGQGIMVTLKITLTSIVLGMVLGTLLAVAFVWQWGLLGAALANLGREVFQILLTEAVRRRLCRDEVPLNAVRIGWILVPAAMVYAVGWYLFGETVDPAMTAEKVGLTLVFLAVAVFGPGLGSDGRAMLAKLLSGGVRRAQSAS